MGARAAHGWSACDAPVSPYGSFGVFFSLLHPLFLPLGEARGLFSSSCSGGRRTDNEGGKLVAAFDSGFLLPALACVPRSDTSAGT